MSLGADIIICSGIINKASGLYGLLSIFTGHPIGALSWILHIASLITIPLYIYAFLSVKNQRALYILFFTHFYFLDTLFSIAFTIVFCVKWFAHARSLNKVASTIAAASASVATRLSLPSDGSVANGVVGQEDPTTTLAAAASSVIGDVVEATAEVLQSTAKGAFSITTAAAEPLYQRFAEEAKTPKSTTEALSQSSSIARESAMTITFTVVFLLVRIYFTFIMIAYARQLVRQQNLRKFNGTPKHSTSAKLQFILLAPFESFWTGFSSKSTASASSYSPLFGGAKSRHRQANSVMSDTTLLTNMDDRNIQSDDVDLEFGSDTLSSPSSTISTRIPL